MSWRDKISTPWGIAVFMAGMVLLPMLIYKVGFMYDLKKVTDSSMLHRDTSIYSQFRDTISCEKITGHRTIYIARIPVDIFAPDSTTAGDILVLPGWNFSRKLWCDSTMLCAKAHEMGYRLIFPEMGKSVYASQYFPETKKEWLGYPKLSWVTDTLIPLLRKKYCIFSGKKNYVVGLSTGARGVVRVIAYMPSFFKAGVALSGDYDQTKITYDGVTIGYYGEYASNKQRWATVDNPTYDISKINTPLYLGHGKADQTEPVSQSQNFYNDLKKAHPNLKVELHVVTNADHNFKYWNSEVDSVLAFFNRNK